VIPFRLRNANAMYQKAMVTLFHNMMHQEVEVYVDDIFAKPKKEEDHGQVLRKLLKRLWKFLLRLNPAKCSFGVRTEKILGFAVSSRGIKVDSNKGKKI
jgi:hypothetical protein